MKKFLKIFLITLAIQLGGIVAQKILYDLESGSNTLSRVGTIILLVSILVAILVDIILAIRWGSNIKQKLIYIFLMPTNYFWLAFVLWAFWYIGQWLDMLSKIYE